MIEQLYGFVTSLWLVLLVVIFSGIVLWVLWPSRRRKTQMQSYADIPFREAPKMDKGAGRDDKKD